MKTLWSLMFLSLLCCTHASAQWGSVEELTVLPSLPDDRSMIRVQLKGLKGDACQLVDSDVEIDGQQIRIATSIRGNPAALCAAVIVPLDIEVALGALVPGDYQVSASINGEASGPVLHFPVSNAPSGLRISPATGSFVEGQDFDLVLLLETDTPWTTVHARLSGANSGSAGGSDANEALMACVSRFELVNGGQAFRCPGIGKLLGAGTHALRVELSSSYSNRISDTVVWTVLEAKE